MADGLVRDVELVSAVGGVAEILAGFQRKVCFFRLTGFWAVITSILLGLRAVRHEIFIDTSWSFS